MDTPAPKKSRNSLYLPLILFVLIIGGLAFLIQFLPNWRSQGPSGGKTNEPGEKDSARKGPGVCRFQSNVATWSNEEKGYIREIEKKEQGHYDFAFDNPATEEGEMGLYSVNCACSAILVGFANEAAWDSWTDARRTDLSLPLPEGAVTTWTRLITAEEAGKVPDGEHPVRTMVKLPAGCKGVLRLTFEGKGEGGSFLRLNPKIWVQPAGYPRDRMIATFDVPVRVVPPVLFFPMKTHLGNITPGGSASAEFSVWSATRAEPKIQFKDEKPLFVVHARPMDDQAKKQLKSTILEKEKILTQIKSAWQVTVTVHEEKEQDGKTVQHDLGPFLRSLSVQVDGELVERGPEVSGSIVTDIDVGEVSDKGRVDLGTFDPDRGARRRLFLWSDAKVLLEYERHEPAEVKVKFTRLEKESTAKRNKWQLDVDVPPDTLFGPFPDHSALYLRLKGPTSRLIRIPLLGTARISGR